jgi:hypothetical protein
LLARSRLLAGCAVTAVLVAACEPTTHATGTLHFAGFLSGAKQRPVPNASTATGQAVVIVEQGGELSYNVTWAGLSGAPTGVHIHGPADAEETAEALVDFSNLPSGSTNQTSNLQPDGFASGNLDVTAGSLITPTVSGDSLMKLMSAGLLYVEVHTAAYPNGEIRTQLKKQ